MNSPPDSTPSPRLTLRHLAGRQPYEPVWRAMQRFTDQRGPGSADELWLVEHEPVYTQGLNGKPEHLLNPGAIPVVPVDRGGQVTYHGPGQAVLYALVDLRRRRMGVRQLVSLLEGAVIGLLGQFDVPARARPDAPGVYVARPGGEAKIASLGLRVRRGCSYHGLALNVDMDLDPFSRINPCGYAGMPVTRLADLGIALEVEQAGTLLARQLAEALASPLDSVPTSPEARHGRPG